MPTLDPITYSGGVWIAKGRTPPDRSIPATYTPPGVAPGSGFWANTTGWYINKSGFAELGQPFWVWCPLPLAQWVAVPGPGGSVVPTMSVGVAAILSSVAVKTKDGKTVPNAALQDGPWPTLIASGGTSLPGIQVVSAPQGVTLPNSPSQGPSGWSGGQIQKVARNNGLYIYNAGQVSQGSNAAWIAVGGGVLAAAAAAAAYA